MGDTEVSLSKEERHVLEAIKGLEQSGMPVVPFAIAIRAGMNVDQCSMILEGLRRKRVLQDINNP
jgi:hypothetical protein